MTVIKIGTITQTTGTKGALFVANNVDNISLPMDSTVLIGYSENFTENYLIQEDFIAKGKKSKLILKNIETIEQASKLKEKAIFMAKDNLLKYNPGHIFDEDVIDCEVIDINSNKLLGKIIEVWHLPANNVWLMESEYGEIPLPVIDDVIKKLDIVEKKLWVEMLEGLI